MLGKEGRIEPYRKIFQDNREQDVYSAWHKRIQLIEDMKVLVVGLDGQNTKSKKRGSLSWR